MNETIDSKSQSAKKLLKEFTGKFVISIFHSPILDSLRLSMTFLEFSEFTKNKSVFLVCYC